MSRIRPVGPADRLEGVHDEVRHRVPEEGGIGGEGRKAGRDVGLDADARESRVVRRDLFEERLRPRRVERPPLENGRVGEA